MRIVLLGPPGSGKGTQAALLSDRLDLPHISTGQLLRAAVRHGTPLGIESRAYIDAGELVPDALMLGLIEERLGAPDAEAGFILDGYPRNLAQAEELDIVLKRLAQPVERALEIRVDEAEIVRRLSKRAAQEGRSDDTGEVVRKRLIVYAEQTAPVSRYYAARSLLRVVDGMGSIEDIQERLLEALS